MSFLFFSFLVLFLVALFPLLSFFNALFFLISCYCFSLVTHPFSSYSFFLAISLSSPILQLPSLLDCSLSCLPPPLLFIITLFFSIVFYFAFILSLSLFLFSCFLLPFDKAALLAFINLFSSLLPFFWVYIHPFIYLFIYSFVSYN